MQAVDALELVFAKNGVIQVTSSERARNIFIFCCGIFNCNPKVRIIFFVWKIVGVNMFKI